MSSAWESFRLSMHILTGPHSARERLIKAYKTHLMHVSPKDMPTEIRQEFLRLATRFTPGQTAKNQCIISHTVMQMDDQEIAATIYAIINMYDALTRYQPIPKLSERASQAHRR